MLTRTHKILVGLLAVQLVLVVVVLIGGGDGGVAKAHPLLPGFDGAKVTKLEISAGPDKPSIVLAKKTGTWVLASGFDYPVGESQVTALLGALGKMSAVEPIATQAARHNQLRVGDAEYDRKIEITADGKVATLFVGGAVGTRRSAVRFGGDDDVYAVNGMSAGLAGAEPRDWIEVSYLHVQPTDVTGVMIVKAGGSRLQLTRDAVSAPWSLTIDGDKVMEPLDDASIERTLGDVAAFEATAPADPKRDASKPTATITLVASSPPDASSGSGVPVPGKPVTVVVDVIDDGASYWVKARDAATAVSMDKARLDPLLTLSKDKLIVKPHTGSGGSGSGDGAGSGFELPPGFQLPPGVQLPPGMHLPPH